MQNLLPPLPDATFPIPNLLPSLPDATTQPQIAITQWPFASSRWPFHDNQRTKTSILCSKCLKTRVPNPKSAQKPRFCAQNARKQGFRRPKKHKNPDFVLGKNGERHRKRRNCHREAQPWPSCKSPRTLLNCKYLITRRLTFADVLGELKSRPSSTLQKYKYLITR